MDCRMTIKTSTTKRFMLFFKNFDVESSDFLSNTCNDWLEVHENRFSSAALTSQEQRGHKSDRYSSRLNHKQPIRFSSDRLKITSRTISADHGLMMYQLLADRILVFAAGSFVQDGTR
ncbi:hypothetical protein CHS0354_000120 [Potamilus streckersoni]|uniref:Uncharacterized protein n=1 Tax=Potamilus streckersoni TaxID=2493646 RepID=A0AAE0RXV5_9BIVA|nr:hypothetical protein CHS0354_000120 [Potamilus streckersoni]